MQIWTPCRSPSINVLKWLPWPADKIKPWCFEPLMIWPQLWSLLLWHCPAIFFVQSYQTMFCVHSIPSLESLPLPSDIGQILFLPLTCLHLHEAFLAVIRGLLNNLSVFLFLPWTLVTFYCDYLSKCVFYCNYLHECVYHCWCIYGNICIPEHVLSLHSREKSKLPFPSNPWGGQQPIFWAGQPDSSWHGLWRKL